MYPSVTRISLVGGEDDAGLSIFQNPAMVGEKEGIPGTETVKKKAMLTDTCV